MIRTGEFQLIERYFAPLCSPGSFGLKDDAALLELPDAERLVVTHDTILEGIHFLPGDPPKTIASKAIRVNVSDLIAKGAIPVGYTVSLGLPDKWEENDIASFSNGLREDQARFGLKLFGGDTYRSAQSLCVGICMFGTTQNDRYVSRLTAAAGDIVAVTGTIGNGALGLDVSRGQLDLSADHARWLRQQYLVPDLNPESGPVIAEFATAAMDVSDGLLGDLAKLCAASAVSATVERNKVPLSPAAASAVASDPGLWDRILGGGDDYEVLFTLPEDRFEPCCKAAAGVGVTVTTIGAIDDGPAGSVTLKVDGKAVDYGAASYSHF